MVRPENCAPPCRVCSTSDNLRLEVSDSNRKRLIAAAALGAGLVAAFLWWRTEPGLPAPKLTKGLLRDFNVLLITVDTLRADIVGAYGDGRGLTPNLDRLALEGIRFTSAFAHATTTLPSHASILTGEYPFRHGIRDNGSFRLADSRETLAELLQRASYQTGAFVGAFVLDARFGLGQGFEHYDDNYGEAPGLGDFHFAERRAEKVLESATSWIEDRDGPWFAWVHLFDPHVPYEPPPSYRNADMPYAGEVAYTDAQVGAFLKRLRDSGDLEKTLLVVTSDHGESLGDHGERTHGLFAYNATLSVPLLLWSDGEIEPGVFREPVGHIDIAPTVLALLDLPVPESIQGLSLSSRRGKETPPIYFEALSSYLTHGLAPLRGLVLGELKFIDLPIPELYDLSADPGESENLASKKQSLVLEMRHRLLELEDDPRASHQGHQASLDPETERRLRSLGYIGSVSLPDKQSFTEDDDPKRAAALVEAHRAALAAFAAGDSEEAARAIAQVIRKRPEAPRAYLDLASILFAAGHLAEAIAVLEGAVDAIPNNLDLEARLGHYFSEAGDLERAAALLKRARERAPAHVEVMSSLGVTYGRMGREEDARALFERIVELDPTSASAHNNLGTTFLREGDFENAIVQFHRAIEIEAQSWFAYEGLGTAFAQTGRLSEAVEAWKRLVALRPRDYDALFNLGVSLAELGRDEEAIVYLERFSREAPPDRYAEDIETVDAIAASLRSTSHSR